MILPLSTCLMGSSDISVCSASSIYTKFSFSDIISHCRKFLENVPTLQNRSSLFSGSGDGISINRPPSLTSREVLFTVQERFLPVGLHKHKYIEFLYVYSGTCENTINGKMISLNAGDICIMNVNTCHSLTCKSENDIAINCLMAREYF